MFVRRIDHLAVIILLLIPWLPPLVQRAEATTIDFISFNAVISTSIDPTTGNEVLSLLVDSSLYGPGGFAGGRYQVHGALTMERGIWITGADTFPGLPGNEDPTHENLWADGTPVLSFILDADRNIVDIHPPDPFRIFLGVPPDDTMPGAGPTLIGELDFSRVTGYPGPLHLSGLQVLAVDTSGRPTGEVYDTTPFTLYAVPEPSSLLVMVTGLSVVLGVKTRAGR